MKLKIHGKTYTGIKEKSLAWYTWKVLKAIGSIISTLVCVLFVLLVCILMLVLG